jgi:glycosyltransferase involved in cell wall biosynthesis
VEEDYALVAAALNESAVDVVSLQHEAGIWGGPDGEWVLELVEALRVPLVTTVHGMARHPTARQQRILAGVANASDAVVVLSDAAATRLARAYGVDPATIEVVPHGVPNLPLVDPDTIKPRLGLDGRRVILSFGLLGPGKACEAVIEAMPAVVAGDPTALYVILGATDTALSATDGEAYREGLVAQVDRLGLADSVRLVDRFMGRVELATWVEAADIVVTPYLDLDRIASGTLAYAMGAGRAIISTPSVYAKERLSRGRGVLVPPGDPDALATAVLRLLGDRKLRDGYGRKAYDDSRPMVWSAVGAVYGRIFERVARPSVRPSAGVRRMSPAGR